MPETPNFPDVLGYISGGARIDYGVLQAAAALRPNPAKAGRPVEVTVILQNTTDSALEVLVVLNVPQRDLSGKSGAFVVKVQRLAIGMQACEVGVLTLPLLSQPGTAPGVYKLGLQVTAKATGKGNRIRQADGGGAFYMGGMSRHAQQSIEALRELRYSGASAKRGGLFSSAPQLEPALILEAGTLGGVLDRKADYRPLWQRRDMKQDPHALLARHKDNLVNYVLPALDRTRLLEPLAKRTMTRFRDSWYELTEIEASLIARVMVRILEYACTGDLSYGRKFLPRPEYEVLPRLGISSRTTRTTTTIPAIKPGSTGTFPVTRTTGGIPIVPPTKQTGGIPVLPTSTQTGGIPYPGGVPLVKLHWLDELVYLLEEDERAARFISRFMPERCYDALLRDALTFSMREVEAATGMQLGSAEELEKFADEWMDKLESGAIMTFADIYLPLVLAGIIVHDEVLLPDENVKVLHSQFQHMLEERADERTDENAALFDMVHDALDKALRKYGLSL